MIYLLFSILFLVPFGFSETTIPSQPVESQEEQAEWIPPLANHPDRINIKDCFPQIIKDLNRAIALFESGELLSEWDKNYHPNAMEKKQLALTLLGVEQNPDFLPPRKLSGCEYQEYLAEGIRTVKKAPNTFEDHRASLNFFKEAQRTVLRDPNFVGKYICKLRCDVNTNNRTGQFLDCYEHCGIPKGGIYHLFLDPDRFDWLDPDRVKPNECAPLSEEKIKKIKERADRQYKLIKKFMPIAIRKIDENLKLLDVEEKLQYKRDIEKLEEKYRAIRNPRCEKRKKDFRDKIEKTHRRLQEGYSSRGYGSSYFLKLTNGDHYLGSSAHVVGDVDSFPFTTSQRLYFLKGFRFSFGPIAKSTIYSTDTDIINPNEDVALKKVPKQAHALPVVSSEEKPRIGQKFIISGYPGSRGGKWTTHTCYFDGYYRNNYYSSPHYYLHCPTMVASPAGMSGGAMTSEDGRAWGHNQAVTGLSNHIIISPISEKDGQVKVGIQDIFLSDHCHKFALDFENEEDIVKQHRCQVMPQGYEQGL